MHGLGGANCPGGTRQGTTVECTVAGGDLEGATGLYFSHPGITAQPTGPNKFTVTVAKDVPVGQYDVRVVAPAKTTATGGEKVPITVRVERAGDWTDSVQRAGFNLPPNTTVALVTVAKNAAEGKVELALPPNARPGTYTFVRTGAGQVPRDYGRPRDAKKPRANNIRDKYPSNPITVTVTASAGAKK